MDIQERPRGILYCDRYVYFLLFFLKKKDKRVLFFLKKKGMSILLTINQHSVRAMSDVGSIIKCITYCICHTFVLCDLKRVPTFLPRRGVSLKMKLNEQSVSTNDISRKLHSFQMFREHLQGITLSELMCTNIQERISDHLKLNTILDVFDIYVEHLTECTFQVQHSTLVVPETVRVHIRDEGAGIILGFLFGTHCSTDRMIEFIRRFQQLLQKEFPVRTEQSSIQNETSKCACYQRQNKKH